MKDEPSSTTTCADTPEISNVGGHKQIAAAADDEKEVSSLIDEDAKEEEEEEEEDEFHYGKGDSPSPPTEEDSNVELVVDAEEIRGDVAAPVGGGGGGAAAAAASFDVVVTTQPSRTSSFPSTPRIFESPGASRRRRTPVRLLVSGARSVARGAMAVAPPPRSGGRGFAPRPPSTRTWRTSTAS